MLLGHLPCIACLHRSPAPPLAPSPHSQLPEGFAVAFAAFTDFGPVMALAIAIHNIPEVRPVAVLLCGQMQRCCWVAGCLKVGHSSSMHGSSACTSVGSTEVAT